MEPVLGCRAKAESWSRNWVMFAWIARVASVRLRIALVASSPVESGTLVMMPVLKAGSPAGLSKSW